MICPECDGKKQLHAHINYGNGPGEWKDIDCSRCKGSGEVPDEEATWIAAGKKFRADRVARGRSLREEAIERGIQPGLLSSMERGMCPPLFDESSADSTTGDT